jgi:hypothetical protein
MNPLSDEEGEVRFEAWWDEAVADMERPERLGPKGGPTFPASKWWAKQAFLAVTLAADETVQQFKDILEAYGKESPKKTMRIELCTRGGDPVVIVTHPMGDEKAMAQAAARTLELIVGTAERLRDGGLQDD